MSRDVRGMVVVITGASAGIGRELARQLARRGARLALTARRADRLDQLNAELGNQHLTIPADVALPADCERIVTATRDRFGRIDTLVCNAGYGLPRRVAETSAEEMLAIFRTNVFGTTDCIRAAVPAMREQSERDGHRGQVMIVSSAAARRGLPYFGAYAATKAAQLSIAEALRVELKSHRIAVTSVHPMGTATDFFTTAESFGTTRIENPTRVMLRQKVEAVAARMVRAIERPRREVWPYRGSRWLLNLNVLFPALGDWGMGRMRRELDEINPA